MTSATLVVLVALLVPSYQFIVPKVRTLDHGLSGYEPHGEDGSDKGHAIHRRSPGMYSDEDEDLASSESHYRGFSGPVHHMFHGPNPPPFMDQGRQFTQGPFGHNHGHGFGFGQGHGQGNGHGFGHGQGHGNGHGFGHGQGHGNGNGFGHGHGFGHGPHCAHGSGEDSSNEGFFTPTMRPFPGVRPTDESPRPPPNPVQTTTEPTYDIDVRLGTVG